MTRFYRGLKPTIEQARQAYLAVFPDGGWKAAAATDPEELVTELSDEMFRAYQLALDAIMFPDKPETQ